MHRNSRRKLIPLLMAVALGAFLAIASEAFNLSNTETLVFGCALTAVLALLGTPLLLLDRDWREASSSDMEDWRVAVRAQIARELAIQARELIAGQEAFDEATGKIQNFQAPFFLPTMHQNLRALNQASASDLLRELAKMSYQTEQLKFLGEAPHGHQEQMPNLAFVPKLDLLDSGQVRHKLDALDVAGFVESKGALRQARPHQEPWMLQPILEATTR